MGFVDLSDVYYIVNVVYFDRKYLRFIWKGIFYQYICLLNGLLSVFRLFIKFLKLVYGLFRFKGYVFVVYIDDFYL